MVVIGLMMCDELGQNPDKGNKAAKPQNDDEHRAADLEKTVSETDVNLQAQKQEKLDELKQKRMDDVQKAEDVERKYTGSEESIDSIATLCERAMRDITKIYDDDKGVVNGLKKFAYCVLNMFGIDMYMHKANRLLKRAQREADELKKRIDYLLITKENLAARLRKEKKIASVTASAFVYAKRCMPEFDKAITRMENELKELNMEQENKPGVDYRPDVDYIKSQIRKLESERVGVSLNILKLSNRLKLSDAKIASMEAIVSAKSATYDKIMAMYADLQSAIDVAKEVIEYGGRGDPFDFVELMKQEIEETKRLGEKMEEIGKQLFDEKRILSNLKEEK